MKKTISTVGAALTVLMSIQGCTQKAESDDRLESGASETGAMEDMADMTPAGTAAREANDDAKMAVIAAKLAVCSEQQSDKEAAALMAAKAEATVKRAEAHIMGANAKVDTAVNENAKKAEELVKTAVATASEATRKANESMKAGLQSDVDAAKEAALSAQKAVIKAAAATADANKAAEAAASEVWEHEVDANGANE